MFAKRPAQSVKIMPQSNSLRMLRIVLISAVMIGCSLLLGHVLKRAHKRHLVDRDTSLFLSKLAHWRKQPSTAQSSPITGTFSDTQSGRLMAYYVAEIEAIRSTSNDILLRKQRLLDAVEAKGFKTGGSDWFYSEEEKCEAMRADHEKLARRAAGLFTNAMAFPSDDSFTTRFKQGIRKSEQKPATAKGRELVNLGMQETISLCEALCLLHATYEEGGGYDAELSSYKLRLDQIDVQAAALSKQIQELERHDPLSDTLLGAHEYEKNHRIEVWLKGWL